MKYSDQLADWLLDLGYTHCFFVAGGNIMHLLESCSHRFTCIPVVHEVAAGIAVEYFNETSPTARAFALVTAGPGLTNILTALAGAYLESRELLVLGGQVKTTDLARGKLRQRGIQEIDGVALAAPVTVTSRLIDTALPQLTFKQLAASGSQPRKGPVFLELPLDIQGAQVNADPPQSLPAAEIKQPTPKDLTQIELLLRAATRPILLIGGGIDRAVIAPLLSKLAQTGIPLMATWNGLDRIPEAHPNFLGRPNTWGQRASNILLQQADLVLALGTRLGLQQTGFNWQQFVPLAKLVQVEIDPAELTKGHPRVDLPLQADANPVLQHIAHLTNLPDYSAWLRFGHEVRILLPLTDPANQTAPGFLNPYDFTLTLSHLCTATDVLIPCSSGGANTVLQQTFQIKQGQRAFNSKSLASMGYGLAGAIGAALAAPAARTILVEGDGGFTQNLQELGTVHAQRLNLKIFLFANDGYASIRMTQQNYFAGRHIGCDLQTGLGLPDWPLLFAAYAIPVHPLTLNFEHDPTFLRLFNAEGPAAFLVPINPAQTYYPKISSRVTSTGSMESNPLHLMTPDLPPALAAKVLPYLANPDANPNPDATVTPSKTQTPSQL